MVNYNPKSWWGLIFRFHKSDTFRILLPAMATIALFTGAIAYVDLVWLPHLLAGTPVVHSLLGLVISLCPWTKWPKPFAAMCMRCW